MSHLDPRLNLFDRISFVGDVGTLGLVNQLGEIAARVRSVCDIPCIDEVRKRGGNIRQFHWPDGRNYLDVFPEGPVDSEAKLEKYLAANLESLVVPQFIEPLAKQGLKNFYKLEFPQRTMGVLYCTPVRLVWDYYVVEDCIAFRLDVLGEVA
jgi:hypothetical protein